MADIRFFTDEDFYRVATLALQRVGIDAVSAPVAGRLGKSDESQLEWAIEQGHVIVTFIVAHFAGLHTRWIEQGRHHAGICRFLPAIDR